LSRRWRSRLGGANRHGLSAYPGSQGGPAASQALRDPSRNETTALTNVFTGRPSARHRQSHHARGRADSESAPEFRWPAARSFLAGSQ